MMLVPHRSARHRRASVGTARNPRPHPLSLLSEPVGPGGTGRFVLFGPGIHAHPPDLGWIGPTATRESCKPARTERFGRPPLGDHIL